MMEKISQTDYYQETHYQAEISSTVQPENVTVSIQIQTGFLF